LTLATREVIESESARVIGAVIPSEGGHRVIEPYEVNTDVVRETAPGVDDQVSEVGERIALEVPDGRSGGDRGGSGEEGEDGGELHFQ